MPQRKRGKRKARRPSAPLKEATVLIPVTFNDGTVVPKSVILSIFDEIFAAFQGWTNEGIVKGAFRMESGRKRVEDLLKITVILNASQLPELRNMVSRWAGALGQEVMLLKITDYRIELIRPNEKGNQP